MTSAQFRAQLRGQETSPFQASQIDDLEMPSGVDHGQSLEPGIDELDPNVEASSEQIDEQQSEDAPVDYSWADSLQAYKDGIHGTALVEILQALSQGQIPEALWDKLHIPLKDGDFEWQDTLANARNGAMMRRKFTQKMQEFARERDAFTNERKQLVEYMGGWKNDQTGQALLQGLRRMGMPFDAMARAYAAEVAKLEDMEAKAPGARALYEEKLKLEQERDELRRQHSQREQQGTQQQSQQDTNRVAQAVKNAAQNSFAANGLQMTPGSWNVFREHLSALWTASGQDAPSLEMVNEAVLATKEFVTQAQQEHQKATAAKVPVKAPLTAKAADSGAPRSVPKNSPIKNSVTAAEFRKRLNANPFG
jgi:hypothetical protein